MIQSVGWTRTARLHPYAMSVVEVVESIVKEGKHFPLPWVVESSLAKRGFRIAPRDPAWLHLFDICQKIDAFLRSYLTLNPIVTLLDLDADLSTCLRSYCMPSLAELRHNPEEISLDAEGDEAKCPQLEKGFESFGLGPILLHPHVLPIFRKSSSRAITASSVISCLSKFGGAAERFEQHLAQQHNVQDIHSELNVSIDAAGLKIYTGIMLQAQEASTKRLAEAVEGREKCSCEEASTRTVIKLKSRRLKIPSRNKTVALMLDKCRFMLSSAYSPSFTKLKGVVRQLELKSEQVLDVVTEYLMLHMGSRKYRQAQYEAEIETPSGRVVHELSKDTREEPGKSCKRKKPAVSAPVQPEAPAQGVRQEYAMQYLSNTDVTIEVPNTKLASIVPSIAAVEIQNTRGVGRWGEALVYQYLLREYRDYSVEWLNEKAESRTAYDIKLTSKLTNSLKSTRFIEGKNMRACVHAQVRFLNAISIVKTTRYSDKNAFEISLNEWEFMSDRAGSIHYDIYRVYNAYDRANVSIAIIRDVYKCVKENKVHLCLAI